MMRFPKISDVAAELRTLNKDEVEEDGIDVRLQVYEDGNWAVRFGSSDYDQDHRGFWGASSVPGNGRRFSATDVARDLIEQAKDAYAQGDEGDDEDEIEEAPRARPRARVRETSRGGSSLQDKKRYAKEFGGSWSETFSPATRRLAAEELEESFRNRAENGEYEHVDTKRGAREGAREAARKPDQHEEAMRILRAEYYGGVRSIAEEVARRVRDGDDEYDAIYKAVDGSYWVIYTHANFQVLMCSDNHDAYTDDFGEPPVIGSEIDWAALAYAAMARDVAEHLNSL